MAKAESSVPGHEPHFLHLVFEEWFGSGHVRVSVRGDGWYAVEVDGRSGWNFWGGQAHAIRDTADIAARSRDKSAPPAATPRRAGARG